MFGGKEELIIHSSVYSFASPIWCVQGRNNCSLAECVKDATCFQNTPAEVFRKPVLSPESDKAKSEEGVEAITFFVMKTTAHTSRRIVNDRDVKANLVPEQTLVVLMRMYFAICTRIHCYSKRFGKYLFCNDLTRSPSLLSMWTW